MENIIKIAFILWTVLFYGNIQASWFKSGSYSDCVIENTKSVTTKNAIHAIESACASKYSEKLPIEDVRKLEGEAWLTTIRGRYLVINLYNNTDYTLTKVSVSFKLENEKKRIYSFDLLNDHTPFSPYTTKRIITEILSGGEKDGKSEFTWEPVSAEGYKN